MRWLNLLTIILTLLSYAAPYVDPSVFSLLAFLGLLFPWLLLANILFILFWLWRKSAYLFFSFTCLLLGLPHIQSFVGFNDTSPSSEGIRVVSYNLFNLRGVGDHNLKTHEDKVKAFRKAYREFDGVEVFAGQEMNDWLVRELGEMMQLPYSIDQYSVSLLTNLRVIDKGVIKFDGKTSNACVWMDLKKEGTVFRVYNMHLQSNKISDKTNKIAQDGNLRDKKTWIDIKTVLSSYRAAAKIRAAQAQTVARHIAQCLHPVVVCGDFNDTPVSYTYRKFANGRKDTFVEKGIGFGTTYAGDIPTLRIDYIIADPSFEVKSHEVYRNDFSDHYGVGAVLSK